MLHTDNHSLIFLNSQSKIKEDCHLRLDAYIQLFHLVLKYKKGSYNQVVDLLSHLHILMLQLLEVKFPTFDGKHKIWEDAKS